MTSLPTLSGTGTPSPASTPTLPDSQPSPLLAFADSVNQAVNLARKKRNESSVGIMAPFQGTVAASDFSSILGNVNKASDTTTKDLIKTVTDANVGDMLSVSEAKDLGVPYGTTKQQAAKMGITPRSTDPADSPFKFSQGQISQLLSGGFNQVDIKDLQSDVAANGLDAVLLNPSVSKTQQALLKRVLAGTNGVDDVTANQFLTTDYFANFFGDDALKIAAKKDGYTHVLTNWDTEKSNYLGHLMQLVQKYREAGQSDQEILKQMTSD